MAIMYTSLMKKNILQIKLLMVLFVGLLLGPLSPSTVLSQEYPNHRVRVVIPFSPGGPTDAIGRLVIQGMSNILGAPFFLEFKPGAGGVIGTYDIARSPADGYSLLMNPSVHVIYASLNKDLKFDPLTDFEPVGLVGSIPLVLVVPNDSPYQTLAELIDAIRKNNSIELNYASPAKGSFSHLAAEVFGRNENVKLTHVAYKGTAPALTDLAGGHINLMFAPVTTALPLIKGKKIRALAITSRTRVASLPEIPTFRENDGKDFEAYTWYGIWAPKGTPSVIVNKLNKALLETLNSEASKKILTDLGTQPNQLSVSQFTEFVYSENRRWSKVIKDAHIESD